MRLEFHPEAELEFIEAAAYYELQVPGLGQRFGADVRRALETLLAHPEVGVAVDDDLRKFVLQRFPFSLIYSLSPDVLASRSWPIKAAAPITGDRESTAEMLEGAAQDAIARTSRARSCRRGSSTSTAW